MNMTRSFLGPRLFSKSAKRMTRIAVGNYDHCIARIIMRHHVPTLATIGRLRLAADL